MTTDGGGWTLHQDDFENTLPLWNIATISLVELLDIF